MNRRLKVMLCLNGERNSNKAAMDRDLVAMRYALESAGIDYTFNPKDNYDIVHLLSSEQYKAFKSIKKTKLGNPSAPVILQAFCDYNDFSSGKEDEKNESLHLLPRLKKEVYKYYKDVDEVMVFWPTQKTILKHYNVENKISVIKPGTKDYFEGDYSSYEKQAFLKYYGLKEDSKIVVSYGEYSYEKGFDILESIARLFPNYEFFFFGGRKGILSNSSHFEKTNKIANLHYEGDLPTELYHSMIFNASCLLLTNSFHIDSTIIIEFMKQGIPVISSKNPFLFDVLIKDKNAWLVKELEEYYQVLKNIEKDNFVINAKEFASTYSIKEYGESLLKEYKVLLKIEE